MVCRLLAPLCLSVMSGCAHPPMRGPLVDHTPAALARACEGRDGWADPAPPARLFGNTYLVGTCGITVVLVTSPEGHVLIDGGPAEAASAVAANITKLGFDPADVAILLSTHEHFDHAGALAELQRVTGADVVALEAAAAALGTGVPDPTDPQAGDLPALAAVPVARRVPDGAQVRSGPLVLTAHATPAHSPGSTSWTWESCEGDVCHVVTYADSISTISAEDYRFVDHPERVAAVRVGLERVAGLPCGILLTPHPAASDLFARFASGAPLVDPARCRAYAERGAAAFEERLARETAGP